jgi:hypothetical protein
MWLINTDDAIVYLMIAGCKHLELLGIHGLDDPILLLHPRGGWKQRKTIELFFNRLEVPSQILELGFDASTDDFPSWILVLGDPEKALSGYFSIGSGLLPLWVCSMEVIDDRFCDFSGLVQ